MDLGSLNRELWALLAADHVKFHTHPWCMWELTCEVRVSNASLAKEYKMLSSWIKFGCCNGAVFSQWSQPGSHSLLSASTSTWGWGCALPNETHRRMQGLTYTHIHLYPKGCFLSFLTCCEVNLLILRGKKRDAKSTHSFSCGVCLTSSIRWQWQNAQLQTGPARTPTPSLMAGRPTSTWHTWGPSLGWCSQVKRQKKISTAQKTNKYLHSSRNLSFWSKLVFKHDKLWLFGWDCGVGFVCINKQENQVIPWFSPQGSLVELVRELLTVHIAQKPNSLFYSVFSSFLSLFFWCRFYLWCSPDSPCVHPEALWVSTDESTCVLEDVRGSHMCTFLM